MRVRERQRDNDDDDDEDEVGVLRRLINCEYGRRLTLKSRDKIRAKTFRDLKADYRKPRVVLI